MFSQQKQNEIRRVLRFKGLTHDPFRRSLYSVKELMEGYTAAQPERSLDARIAQHFRKKSGIFQDVAHNSYWSFHSRGPMVFLGSRFSERHLRSLTL